MTDVLVVGGGIAGRTAALFTSRHGLDTHVIDAGGSIVRRNAHLENFPGFPAGVNARLFLDLLDDQLERSGAQQTSARVTTLVRTEDGFEVQTDTDERYQSTYVILATKNEVGYLEDLEGLGIIDRGSMFVETDERGRTGIDGLYAAGRLAQKPHQAIICAGDGAEVAVTLLEDVDTPFYHDWVAPDGYFTDRGRDLPPGCEEIDADERNARESASLEYMRSAFAESHPDEQETHPSLVE